MVKALKNHNRESGEFRQKDIWQIDELDA